MRNFNGGGRKQQTLFFPACNGFSNNIFKTSISTGTDEKYISVLRKSLLHWTSTHFERGSLRSVALLQTERQGEDRWCQVHCEQTCNVSYCGDSNLTQTHRSYNLFHQTKPRLLCPAAFKLFSSLEKQFQFLLFNGPFSPEKGKILNKRVPDKRKDDQLITEMWPDVGLWPSGLCFSPMTICPSLVSSLTPAFQAAGSSKATMLQRGHLPLCLRLRSGGGRGGNRSKGLRWNC